MGSPQTIIAIIDTGVLWDNREIVNRLKRRVITIDSGRIVSDQEVGKYLL